MKTLKTAVVGLGRIGWQFHAPEIAAHPGLDLIAVVDPLEDRRQEAAAKFGAKPYSTLEQLLQETPVDLVVIASPTQFHADQAILAFDHRCDVFCDKPLAPSLAEADRMIEHMNRTGRKMMAYQPHRARAEIVALRDILHQGWIGPLYAIKRANTNYVRRNDWQAFRKNGGGMLNNYGAHYVDQLLYLAGSRAKRISCALRAIATLGDADDVVRATIETENGIILDLDINMAAAHPIPPWYVMGQHGSIVWQANPQAWHVRYYDPQQALLPVVDERLAAPGRRYPRTELPWQNECVLVSDYQAIDYYEQCYAYFAQDKPPYIPISETHELIRVLETCRHIAESEEGVEK